MASLFLAPDNVFGAEKAAPAKEMADALVQNTDGMNWTSTIIVLVLFGGLTALFFWLSKSEKPEIE